jgi:hypothetical protein
MSMLHESKCLLFPSVNSSQEMGTHPHRHIYCIEQEVADDTAPINDHCYQQHALTKDTDDEQLQTKANKWY